VKVRHGTAILELIFGLMVVALVASIGTATISLISDDHLERREAATLSRERILRQTLVEWLENAHASLGGVFQVIDATRHGRNADVLLFTTTAPTPLGTPETTIRLYVNEDDRTIEKGLAAELTSWPNGPSARIAVDTTVVAIDVQCLTNLLGGRRWVPSWLSSELTPRAVEVKLRRAPDRPGSGWLDMPIVVALEGGR
jgi:hypothetical protein